MAYTAFDGKLNVNEVYSDLFNTILRHVVFSDNIYDTKASLLDMSRVDGGLYGDTALYTSFDLGGTYEWLGDAEAANLLDVNRNETEVTQKITVDKFRQINLTLDNYLSKRAWEDESAFSQFNSALLQSINDVKRVHDSTMFNTFIGTNESEIGRQQIEIEVPAEPAGTSLAEVEAYNRLVAQTIAMKVSDLMVDLEDVTRDFNDYGYLRSVSSGDLIAVWNSAWVNKINKLDIPMIYNSLQIDKKGEYTLPARYFGTIKEDSGTGDGTVRYLEEHTVGGKVYNAGDIVPTGTAYEAGEVYTPDDSIAFKIMHKGSVPFMSAFSTATEFWNPRALLSNHYLTWGYNTLEHLAQYPFITVRVKNAA